MTEPQRRFRSFAARAAAEFAVVVVGVTIALWADGWAAERKDREAESIRVRALSDNVEATVAEIREARQEADSAAAALRELASPRRPDRADVDLERALLRSFFYVPVFHPELNVYEDLKNSGELSLLRDAELRRGLSELDSQLEQVRIQQADMSAVQQLNLDSFLIERVDLRPVLGDYLGLDGSTGSRSMDLSFMHELEFRNLVLFKLDLTDEMARQFARTEEALLAVQRSIAAQSRSASAAR